MRPCLSFSLGSLKLARLGIGLTPLGKYGDDDDQVKTREHTGSRTHVAA